MREIILLLDGISVGRQSTRERESGFTLCLCKCLASTKFGSSVAMCLPARVVARTPTTATTDTISLCVASLTTGRVFATSQCEARNTIEEIILNLDVWGEEEKKKTVLVSSRKRAKILYRLKWKSIVLVFNRFVCIISIFSAFLLLFYIVSQNF